jgi:hypothetical protein
MAGRGGQAASFCAVVLLAAAGFGGCLGGSETGNPTKGLTGQIRTMDGLPAARTRVVLVPEGYVPADAHPPAGLAAVMTDGQGRYAFPDVASGRYNLEAMNPADGTRARAEGIETGNASVEIPAQTLGMPGSIAAALKGAADTVTGFIYVPGSTFRAPVRGSDSIVRLDSLPPGQIDSLVYGNASAMPPRTFAWNLRVQPSTESQASGPFLAWRRSAVLTVDGGPAGAKISADVAGIPLRIVLPDSVLGSGAKDGSDVRVSNEQGAELPGEVQSQGGSAALWVRMDTVYADRPTRIRLYWDYGGSGPLPAAKPGKVFSPADGFAGAWHLDEDPAANNGRLADASGQGNDGMTVGYTAAGSSDAGVAGGALKFDGKSQFAGTKLAFDDPEAFTVLIWFRAGHTQGGRIFEFADKDTSRASYWDRLLHIYPDGTLHYGVFPPDSAGKGPTTKSSFKILGTSKAYDDGAWHQVAVRLSPLEGQTMFVDGARIANDPATRTAQIIAGYWRLGWGQLSAWAPAGSGEYFQGSLDEFWAMHAARADDFVKLSYENLKSGSRLIQWP